MNNFLYLVIGTFILAAMWSPQDTGERLGNFARHVVSAYQGESDE